MKDWLTIGQFAQKVSLSQKALRVYEKAGLIQAHQRGDNGYRYYTAGQIEVVENIKLFKSFGFSLVEIRSLLEIDKAFNPEKLYQILEKRLLSLRKQQSEIEFAQARIQKIMSSLKAEKTGIAPDERRFIMSQLEKLKVVVTGVSGLEKTAQHIKSFIGQSGKDIPVLMWDRESFVPVKSSYVLVVPEKQLIEDVSNSLSPDIVVIKEVSEFSEEIIKAYQKLYREVGPHMSTIMNADDRAVIALANSEWIRKGRTYYFSKNSGLVPQISRIGGVVSDGETVEIYGFNQNLDPLEIKLNKILSHSDEMSYLASLAATMDLGLQRENLVLP